MSIHDMERTEHPRFGMIHLGKVQGGSRTLFGSDVTHDHYVRLTIEPGKNMLDRDLMLEHKMATGIPFIEVSMSYAQLTEMLFSNMGHGVPCTIDSHRDGEFRQLWQEFPDVPADSTIQDYIQEIEKAATNQAAHMTEAADMVAALRAKKGAPTKGELDELSALIGRAKTDANSTMPFLLKQTVERVENVTAQAKADIASSVTHSLEKMGLASLQEKLGVEVPEPHALDFDKPHPESGAR